MGKHASGLLCYLIWLVSLCGCGVQAPDAVPTPTPATLPGRAADIMEEETLLTVDGRDIPAWEYLYWLSLACDRARGQSAAPDWDSVKEQALMNTALYASVETLAERNGIQFTDADAAAVSERWRQRCEAYGGEVDYLREIARYGLDRAKAETLFRAGLLYGKLRTLCREGGIFSPDAAALDALAKESGAVRVDRILSTDWDYNAAKRRAEAFFRQLNGASDQAALFSELTWEGGDHEGPRILKDGTFDERLTQVARALQIGQISGIIESSDGFSILRRLSPERDSLLETWVRRTVEETARKADVEVTEDYRAIDAAGFSSALEELRKTG